MTRLLYFGRVSDLTGLGEHSATLPETVRDTAALRQWADDVMARVAGSSIRRSALRLMARLSQNPLCSMRRVRSRSCRPLEADSVSQRCAP